MGNEKDALPSDLEHGALKPQPENKPNPATPPSDEKESEEDPSEQPS